MGFPEEYREDLFILIKNCLNSREYEINKEGDLLLTLFYHSGFQYLHNNDIDSFFNLIKHFLVSLLQEWDFLCKNGQSNNIDALINEYIDFFDHDQVVTHTFFLNVNLFDSFTIDGSNLNKKISIRKIDIGDEIDYKVEYYYSDMIPDLEKIYCNTELTIEYIIPKEEIVKRITNKFSTKDFSQLYYPHDLYKIVNMFIIVTNLLSLPFNGIILHKLSIDRFNPLIFKNRREYWELTDYYFGNNSKFFLNENSISDNYPLISHCTRVIEDIYKQRFELYLPINYKEFRIFWKQYSHILFDLPTNSKLTPLYLAFRKLNNSLSEENLEKAFIDSISGLETLFICRNNRKRKIPISKTLRNTVASLYPKNLQNEKKQLIFELYDIRGSITHNAYYFEEDFRKIYSNKRFNNRKLLSYRKYEQIENKFILLYCLPTPKNIVYIVQQLLIDGLLAYLEILKKNPNDMSQRNIINNLKFNKIILNRYRNLSIEFEVKPKIVNGVVLFDLD